MQIAATDDVPHWVSYAEGVWHVSVPRLGCSWLGWANEKSAELGHFKKVIADPARQMLL